MLRDALYWRNTGSFWRDNYAGRRATRFYTVLEETYQEAVKKPPSMPPAAVAVVPRPLWLWFGRSAARWVVADARMAACRAP